MTNVKKSFLDKQRMIADPVSDKWVTTFFEKGKHDELYTILHQSWEVISTSRSDLGDFILTKRVNPQWFSEERIINGQQVFKTYASEIMTLLAIKALPFCYAGSPGNKALFLSPKMRKSPGKRLLDTAEFILGVSTPGNLTTSDIGYFHINKTRLIHSIARYHISSNSWNHEWGVPINQEDMAGTNLAFSYIILNGLRQSGFTLSRQQKEDFIYLWRYIGYQMGIQEELLPSSYSEAFKMKQKIVDRNFKESEEGIALTTELLKFYKTMLPADKSLLIASQVRYFLGDRIADYLNIEKDILKDWITLSVNSFKELQNFFSLHQDSYRMMIANHEKIKEKM